MRCSSTVSATPACLPPALTACPRSRRVTPELLMGETGLERLAKISRDKNAFKRTRDVVRTLDTSARREYLQRG